MSISFYEASVGSFQQILGGVANVLEKGAAHASEKGIDLQDIVMTRIHEDMMPFHFQLVAVEHMSAGLFRALRAGSFSPPSFECDKSYGELQTLIADAQKSLAALDEAEVEALGEGSIIFKVAGNELPFTNENFLLSFAHPNFYFHSTTTYSILRHLGVPLGKMDFLGQMKIGA